MKKLKADDVGVVFSIFLIISMLVISLVFLGISETLVLIGIITLGVVVIAFPYVFTWFWNTYVASEEDDGSNEG